MVRSSLRQQNSASRDDASPLREDRVRIHNSLKRLAARGPSPWPVLSVYVNTRPVGPQMATFRPFLKKRMGEELRLLKARSPEHESLQVDFARVQHYLDYDLREETRGTALFACYADGDLFDAVQVPVEFSEPVVTVGPLPTLDPLLHVDDRYRRAAVLVADTNAARLFVVALGAVEVRREVRNAVLHKSKNAGEADPSRMAHHVEEAWLKHARQCIQSLEELVIERSCSWILIGGDQVIVPALLAELSNAGRERLLGHLHWDIRVAEVELAAEVTARVEERERNDRIRRAQQLLEATGEGRAVLGVTPVIGALREARSSDLLLSEAFPAGARAWACRACRTFGAGEAPGACPACGRAAVQEVALREEIGAQALAQGSSVGFVPAGAVPEFEERGGVGALVRYR
jgi:rubrerythrin